MSGYGEPSISKLTLTDAVQEAVKAHRPLTIGGVRYAATSYQSEAPERGAWVVYSLDAGPQAEAIFDDEIDALRMAVGSGYQSVAFWRFGGTLREAVTAAKVPAAQPTTTEAS